MTRLRTRDWSDATAERPLFVKTLAAAPDGFFGSEARGLELLRASGSVLVPEVHSHSDEPGAAYLALDWVDAGRPSTATDEAIGRGLAGMHTSWLDRFGGDGAPGYLGSVPLDTSPAGTWAELWAERRLQSLARAALDRGRIAAPSLPTRRSPRWPTGGASECPSTSSCT